MGNSSSKKRRKRKEVHKVSGFARFIFQDNRGPVFCPLCIKEKGKKAKPLSYFPVLVPQPPVGERILMPELGDDAQPVKWHHEYIQMCLKHAIETLKVIDPKELEPREGLIRG